MQQAEKQKYRLMEQDRKPGTNLYIYVHLTINKGGETVKVKVSQSCPTLCNPMYYTVHGILQARILEWVAFPFSRGSSQTRARTQVSCNVGRFFTSRATRKAQEYYSGQPIHSSANLPNSIIKLVCLALQVDFSQLTYEGSYNRENSLFNK